MSSTTGRTMKCLATECRIFLISVPAILVLLLYYISLGMASNALNFLGVGVLAATSLLMIKSRGGWIFLLYAFGLTFALASTAMIELTEMFLIEVSETPYLTGAAARNAFLASFFLIMAHIVYNIFLRIVPNRMLTIKSAEPILLRFLLAIAFAAPIYIFGVLLAYGSPLLLGMDRFTYFTNIAPPGYKLLYGNIPILGFAVSLAVYKGLVRQRISIFWFLFTILVYIMAGEKFSQIFLLAFFFFIPFFMISSPTIKTRHMFFGAISLAAMGVLVIINYTMISGSAEIFVPRLALQGQMNYALDKITGHLQPMSTLINHFAGVGAHESERGLPYLMYLVAPDNIVDSRLAHGATFTAPFPSNIAYFFGSIMAPVFIFPLAIMAGAVSAITHKSTISKNIIISMISLKTFELIYVAITMGDTDLFFGLKAILQLMSIFIYLTIVYTFSRQVS